MWRRQQWLRPKPLSLFDAWCTSPNPSEEDDTDNCLRSRSKLNSKSLFRGSGLLTREVTVHLCRISIVVPAEPEGREPGPIYSGVRAARWVPALASLGRDDTGRYSCRRSSKRRRRGYEFDVCDYWMPAFAGMTGS